MNTCASCHASGRGGAFVLTRSNGTVGRGATQLNLAAAIEQISFDEPAASPLLYKACCAHGGAAQAALANRQAPPFLMLQGWVQMVVTQNPHLKPRGTSVEITSSKTQALEPPAARSVEIFSSTSQAPASSAPGTARLLPSAAPAAPASPYDPAPFNAMAHPSR